MTMTLKKTIIIAVVVIGIPALALAWWLLSPLFLNTTVEEEFPFSATADMPVGMTQTEAENVMSGIAKVNMEAMEDMPDEMAEAERISSGSVQGRRQLSTRAAAQPRFTGCPEERVYCASKV